MSIIFLNNQFAINNIVERKYFELLTNENMTYEQNPEKCDKISHTGFGGNTFQAEKIANGKVLMQE